MGWTGHTQRDNIDAVRHSDTNYLRTGRGEHAASTPGCTDKCDLNVYRKVRIIEIFASTQRTHSIRRERTHPFVEISGYTRLCTRKNAVSGHTSHGDQRQRHTYAPHSIPNIRRISRLVFLQIARDGRLLVRGDGEVVAEPAAAVDHLLARALRVRDVAPRVHLRRADGGDVWTGRGEAWCGLLDLG